MSDTEVYHAEQKLPVWHYKVRWKNGLEKRMWIDSSSALVCKIVWYLILTLVYGVFYYDVLPCCSTSRA